MFKYHIKFHFRQQLALQGGFGSTNRVLSYVTVSQHLSYGQLVEVIFFFMTVKGGKKSKQRARPYQEGCT